MQTKWIEIKVLFPTLGNPTKPTSASIFSSTFKNSDDVIIRVPQGTIIKDLDTSLIIADLNKKNSEAIVAYGGRGGRGNTAFKTQNNTCPNFSEKSWNFLIKLGAFRSKSIRPFQG